MIWEVLKIEETTDKRAITRAYRDLLSDVNPEEKPEEFKLLRSAYEEALKYAEQKQAEEEAGETSEKSPVEQWADRLAKVYGSVDTRRDLTAWDALLSEDICVSLDTKPLIEEAMLRFFLEHYRIPHKVWVYLNERFQFTERVEELNGQYPEEFVRYIILGGIEEMEPVPFDLFPAGTDGETADEYIRVYLELCRTDFTEAADGFARFEALPVKHPYGDALRCRYDKFLEDETAIVRLREIHTAYPEEQRITMDLMLVSYHSGEFEEALSLAEELLEKDPEHDAAMQIKARSYAALENYKDAVEVINQIMNQADGDQKKIYEMDQIRREWNVKLIEQYEKKMEEEPEDADNLCDLTWCYLQNDMPDKAYSMLEKLKVDHPTPSRYAYLVFLIRTVMEQKEESLEAADRFLAIDGVAEAETEEDVKKALTRRVDALVRKSVILLEQHRYEEVVEALHEVKGLKPDDAEMYTRSCYMYRAMKMDEEALVCARETIRLSPEHYHGYMMAALVYFDMHRDNDAFQMVNQAMEIERGDLQTYLLKLRILVRNNAFDPAEDLIGFLKENGITEDPTVRWCELQIMDRRDADKEGALAGYRELDEKIADMEDKPSWLPRFYYLMAIELADVKDAKEDYTRGDILEVLEKGLAADPDDFDCQEYKGWLLKKDNKIEESLAIYHKLEKVPRNNLYIEKQLAELYYEDDMNDAMKSLHYYEMIAENEEDSRVYHLNVAYLYYITKQFDQAEKHLMRALEISPDEAWIFYRLTQLYLVQRRLEDAFAYAQKALEETRKKVTEKEKRRSVYWENLAQVLRRMNRPKEAVAVYKAAAEETTSYKNYWQDVYDTYISSSMWEELRTHLKEWKKSKQDRARYWNADVSTLLYSGKHGAWLQFVDKQGMMDPSDRTLINAVFMAGKKSFKAMVAWRKETLDRGIQNQWNNLCSEYSNYAMSLWYAGRYEEAHEAAAASLKEYEKYANQYNLSVPIYVGAMSVALALTGYIDEARKAVGNMLTVPACSFCKYPVCKDVYIYRAEIEIIAGNLAEAAEMVRQGKLADPSDEGYAFAEAYLKMHRVSL